MPSDVTENNFKQLEKTDEVFSDESLALIEQWCDHYSERFLESEYVKEVLSEAQRVALPFVINCFFGFYYMHSGLKPGQWDECALQEVCVDIIPANVVGGNGFFDAVVPCLYCFVVWMSSENYLSEDKDIHDLILSLAEEIIKKHKNSDNWSVTKKLLIGMQKRGYDLENAQAIEAAFMSEDVNALLEAANSTHRYVVFGSDLLNVVNVRDMQAGRHLRAAQQLCACSREDLCRHYGVQSSAALH